MKRGGGVTGVRCGVELGATLPWRAKPGAALEGDDGGSLLRCGRRKKAGWAERPSRPAGLFG
jgi:hypothetical protein